MLKRLYLTVVFLPCFICGAWAGNGSEPTRGCGFEPTDIEIQIGEIVTCQLGIVDGSDSFRFFVSVDSVLTLYFTSIQAPPQSAVFEVFDPSGQPLPIGSPGGSGFGDHTFRVEANVKPYTINVSHTAQPVGAVDYVLVLESVSPLLPTTPFICFGCTSPSRIDPPGDLDQFFFKASAGDVVRLQLDNPLLSFKLLDPDGDPVENGDLSNVMLSKAGEYTVQVYLHLDDEGQEDAVADYALTLQCLAGNCRSGPVNCGAGQDASADLLLSSNGPATQSGDRTIFPFRIENIGEAEAPETIVSIIMPQGTVFAGATSEEGICSESRGIVSCFIGTLGAGQRVDITLSVRVPPLLTRELQTLASVLTIGCDSNNDNNRALIKADAIPSSEIDTALFFPQIADGLGEDSSFQTSLLLSNPGEKTTITVEFVAPDGLPMELDLVGLGELSSFSLDLEAGHSITLMSRGSGELKTGYARMRGSERIGGVLVFTRTDLTSGISLSETGVAASELLTNFRILVDSTGDRDTGLAMVYPAPEVEDPLDAQVTVRLYDLDFNPVSEEMTFSMSPGSHMARFVHELFEDQPQVQEAAREIEGLLTVVSDRPLMAVTLRQSDAPGAEFPQEVPFLTTFPVIEAEPIP